MITIILLIFNMITGIFSFIREDYKWATFNSFVVGLLLSTLLYNNFGIKSDKPIEPEITIVISGTDTTKTYLYIPVKD